VRKFCQPITINNLTCAINMDWERILLLVIYGNFKFYNINCVGVCACFGLNVVISISIPMNIHSSITHVLHIFKIAQV